MSQESPELERILHVARLAAAAAGELLCRYLGTASIEEKQSHNLVTQADLEAEALVTQIIQTEFPDHSLLREEAGASGDQAADHMWIIDPLDGTNNYAHGVPHFSVSIAYARQGEPQVGVVLDPIRRELFTAMRDQGAWLNDRPIRVSTRNGIPQSLIATGFYYDRGRTMELTLHAIHKLFQHQVRGIRRTGGAALDLCWVASGRFEAFFEYQLAPWDYAAGALIVHEAGGKCCDRRGTPLNLHSGSVIAANASVMDPLLDIVRWPE